MPINAGDQVINKAKPEWGHGTVLNMTGNIALVRFHNKTVRKLRADFLAPAPSHKQSFCQQASVSGQAQSKPGPKQTAPDEMADAGPVAQALAMLKQMQP
ncbi:MAG: DUF3553 domain-containing protein [Mailhella sp.]|nr:DUF3553 domain-containing protein [Mailhella sp.]